MTSKGFPSPPENGPKYVTYVALWGVRVAEQPRRAASFSYTPYALLFTGRVHRNRPLLYPARVLFSTAHHEGRLTYLFRPPCARGRYLSEGTGSVAKKGATSPCAIRARKTATSTERRVGSPRRGSWRRRRAAEKKSTPGGEPKNRKRSR